MNHRATRRITWSMGLLLAAGACSSDSPSQPADPPEPEPPEEPDPRLGPQPVLWNLGVNFENSFKVEDVETVTQTLYEFGHVVLDFEFNPKALPHFTYSVEPGSDVVSPMEGTVESVHLQNAELQDYSIWLKPQGAPTVWLLEIDHITDLTIDVGDEVQVGDLLGHAPVGALELMAIGPDAHPCPLTLFAPEVRPAIEAKLTDFMAAWDSAKWALPVEHFQHPEHVSGYYTPYADRERVAPGCLVWEIAYEDG